MADDLERTPYPKRGKGRPRGIPNPNAGRKKGVKTAGTYVREATIHECKHLAEQKAMWLTNDIIEEESRLAFSDVRTLFDAGWNPLPPSELPREVSASISSIKVVRRVIPKKHGNEEETTYQYTFWDKGRALERLSRHLGLYERDNLQKDPDRRPQINVYLEQGDLTLQGGQPLQSAIPANGYGTGE